MVRDSRHGLCYSPILPTTMYVGGPWAGPVMVPHFAAAKTPPTMFYSRGAAWRLSLSPASAAGLGISLNVT
jgi:hypothetical protein